MIRAADEVREPRGISWQNWAATCKDVITDNKVRAVFIVFAVLAAIGGGLYARHIHSGYAKHNSKPHTLPRLLNLQDTSSAKSEAKTITPSMQGNTSPSVLAPHVTQRAVLGASTVACDQAAAHLAQLTYQTSTATENAYHTAQLDLISTVNSALSLAGSHRTLTLDQENARHHSVLQHASATLTGTLQDAHCL